jgi:hypothetical protein
MWVNIAFDIKEKRRLWWLKDVVQTGLLALKDRKY